MILMTIVLKVKMNFLFQLKKKSDFCRRDISHLLITAVCRKLCPFICQMFVSFSHTFPPSYSSASEPPKGFSFFQNFFNSFCLPSRYTYLKAWCLFISLSGLMVPHLDPPKSYFHDFFLYVLSH